jgi:hypothetical protein
MEAINKLAAELGCSPIDLKSLAVRVADSMRKDKVADTFIANPEFQVSLCEAYVADQLKKYERFLTTYLAFPAARLAFQGKVLELMGE